MPISICWIQTIALWSLVIAILFMPGTKIDRYNKAIEDCEKNLPRDQNCVITAIPKK
jgi:hypothetical protein